MQPIDNEKRQAIVDGLLHWFAENKRTFPWRSTFQNPDPYLILFTEIMLQRTKADQVVPVYEEFLRRYPSFDHIAKASDREIVSLFSRLGLRWRARNVVKLIRALRRQHNGVVPRDPDQLRDLPAVGEYVARAVLCYAFGERIPPIDANVVRVISRLFGLSGKADVARRSRQISEITGSLIPEEMSRDFNLSLLDFGALVCRPKPLCHMCPLSRHCSYYGKSQANEKMKF